MPRVLWVSIVLSLWCAVTAQIDFLTIARDRSLDEVRAAIYLDADVNQVDAYGQSALMYAASHNEDLEVHALIVAAGADVNARSLAGWSALMYAVRDNPNPQVVSKLLELGADPTLTNTEGHAALHYAPENIWLQDSAALSQLRAAIPPPPPAPPAVAPPPPAAPAAPVRACCKLCRKGKACGNSCINRGYTCHKGVGCACNAGIGTDDALISAGEQLFPTLWDPAADLGSCDEPQLGLLP